MVEADCIISSRVSRSCARKLTYAHAVRTRRACGVRGVRMGGAQERACRVHAACMWRACGMHVRVGGPSGDGARAWLKATPGCSSSSRWMYWGNFRFMPKTPVTTAPMPIVIEMAVAITSILRRRLRAESRL